MIPLRGITPHMSSSDSVINASLTLLKLHKRIRTINPGYKPSSLYQARLKHKRAARRMKHGTVR